MLLAPPCLFVTACLELCLMQYLLGRCDIELSPSLEDSIQSSHAVYVGSTTYATPWNSLGIWNIPSSIAPHKLHKFSIVFSPPRTWGSIYTFMWCPSNYLFHSWRDLHICLITSFTAFSFSPSTLWVHIRSRSYRICILFAHTKYIFYVVCIISYSNKIIHIIRMWIWYPCCCGRSICRLWYCTKPLFSFHSLAL